MDNNRKRRLNQTQEGVVQVGIGRANRSGREQQEDGSQREQQQLASLAHLIWTAAAMVEGGGTAIEGE